VADRAAPAGCPALATLLGAGRDELEPAGGAAGDPDAAQQVQGWLGTLVGRVGLRVHPGTSSRGSWCPRPGRVNSAPASFLVGMSTAGRRCLAGAGPLELGGEPVTVQPDLRRVGAPVAPGPRRNPRCAIRPRGAAARLSGTSRRGKWISTKRDRRGLGWPLALEVKAGAQQQRPAQHGHLWAVPAADRQRQRGDAGGELERDGWSWSHAAASMKTGQLVRPALPSTQSGRQPSGVAMGCSVVAMRCSWGSPAPGVVRHPPGPRR
jgi:hypothetical protein